MAEALLIDDDPASLDALATFVEQEGYRVRTAVDLASARRYLQATTPDLVLSDLVLPDGSGTQLLREVEDRPGLDFVLITGHASVDSAIEALRMGAVDYLTKPVDEDQLTLLLSSLKQSRTHQFLAAELPEEEPADRESFGALLGASPAMRQVFELLTRCSPTDATVLLHGESGTGKELAAQTLHQLSARRERPFIAVNCSALSENLVESELFGHERGAFTGADRTHQGLFERAHKGTLFLDEITEMPMGMQTKLLRVMETGLVTRVGGSLPKEVDVRIVSATNRDPVKAVEEERLREDLYYRLNVFPICLPPLRERGEDIELLALAFLQAINRRQEEKKTFAPGALEALRHHRWPGNVRELKNAVQRAYILAGDQLTEDDLLGAEAQSSGGTGDAGSQGSLRLQAGMSIAAAERQLILLTLEKFGGDKKRAAETLGVSLKTLYNRLHSYREGA